MDPSKNLFGGGLHGPAGQNVDVAAAIATFESVFHHKTAQKAAAGVFLKFILYF